MFFQTRFDMHKSHNAPVLFPTMHPFVTEMCFCVHIYVKLGYIWDFFLIHCGICQMGLIGKEGFCIHGAHKQYSTHTLAVAVAAYKQYSTNTLVVVVVVAVAVVVTPVVVVVAETVCSHKSVFNPCLLCLTETVLRNDVCVYRQNQS